MAKQARRKSRPPARAGSNDRANAAVPPAPGPADPDAHERRRHSLTEFICAAFDQQIARVKALLAENSSRSLKSESHLPLVRNARKRQPPTADGSRAGNGGCAAKEARLGQGQLTSDERS